MGTPALRTRPTDDIDLIRELDEICFPLDDRSPVECPKTHWWVIEDTSTKLPAAYAGAYTWACAGERALVLSRAGVLPEYRGRGLQRRLLLARERYARREGAPEIWTYTSHRNIASNNNLMAAGYRLWMPAQWGGSYTPWKPEGETAWLYWRKFVVRASPKKT